MSADDPKPWRPPPVKRRTKGRRERRKGPHRIETLEDMLIHELTLIEIQINEIEKRRTTLSARLTAVRHLMETGST
jgi:hypothetical protein